MFRLCRPVFFNAAVADHARSFGLVSASFHFVTWLVILNAAANFTADGQPAHEGAGFCAGAQDAH